MKLGKLFRGVTGAVLGVPIAVVKDVFTIGGIMTENGKTYTKEKLEEVEEKLDEAFYEYR